MHDHLGVQYGDVPFVRRATEVGYRGLNRGALVSYYRILMAATKAVHMTFVWKHTGAPGAISAEVVVQFDSQVSHRAQRCTAGVCFRMGVCQAYRAMGKRADNVGGERFGVRMSPLGEEIAISWTSCISA
jgi:hypothetical protein